jgi:hypothetical protein
MIEEIPQPSEQIEAVSQPENALPSITIVFDPGTQAIANIKFDSAIWKTWNFIVAVLGMAVEEAKRAGNMALQAKAMQAVQEQAMLDSLKNGGGRNRQ